jgi:hypothetical protein
MAHHLLLHGTLDAILEADHLTNPTRATGGAPGIFRKVKSADSIFSASEMLAVASLLCFVRIQDL